MFEVYPGFEELPLRVEVEWHGSTRVIIARLERWLDSKAAALICQFVDDANEGEWVIVDKGSGLPYTMGRPDKLLGKSHSFDEQTRVLLEEWDWKPASKEKLLNILQRAFCAENFAIARLLELPELPAHRNIALCSFTDNRWLYGLGHCNWAAFSGPSLFTDEITRAQQQLRAQWKDEKSDVRFAWEWAALDNDQRRHKMGWPESWRAMERIMNLVLASATNLWRVSDEISWYFHLDGKTGKWVSEVWSDGQDDLWDEKRLRTWDELLVAHFVPHWREDLFQRYSCLTQYEAQALFYNASDVEAAQPPTAHEQIEAKLALRDWLADAATPDVAALLASLDA